MTADAKTAPLPSKREMLINCKSPKIFSLRVLQTSLDDRDQLGKKWYLSHKGLPFELRTASGKQTGSKTVLYNMHCCKVTANHVLPFCLFVNYCPSLCFQTYKTAHAFISLAFDITFHCLAKKKKMSQNVMNCWQTEHISTYDMAAYCRNAFRGCETQICVPSMAFLRSGFKSEWHRGLNSDNKKKIKNLMALHPNVCPRYWVGWQRRS